MGYKLFTNEIPLKDLEAAAMHGAKVIYMALGTMALSDRWDADVSMYPGGNLPAGTTGKVFCQHIWKTTIAMMRALGEGYHCVLCIGQQADALDFLEGENEEDKLEGLPKNMTLRTSVQQVEVLEKHTHVFVTHAGFNSLQESLIAGVPMVALPQAVDQPENARKIEAAGWGHAFLRPMSTVTPTSLANAVAEVVAQDSFRKAVLDSSTELCGGDVKAAERVVAMAKGHVA